MDWRNCRAGYSGPRPRRMVDVARRDASPDGSFGYGGATRAVSLFVLVMLWWATAYLVASPQLFPGPLPVAVVAWRQTIDGELPWNVAITLARVVAAFGVAMLVGGVLGYAAGRFRRVDQLVDPWAVTALNLPVLVVVVLAYIWVGLNDTAAVLAVAIAKAPT